MNWLGKSYEKSKKLRDHYKMKEIDIYIKDALPDGIDPDIVFKFISNRIPNHLLSGIDVMYVGDFEMFKEKEVNAIYEDGAIYISNSQSNHEDMADDIVHELAHSVEEKYKDFLYSDQALKKEFLGKRKRLYHILLSHDYKPMSKIASTYVYDKQIDMYFYKEVGYDAMWNIVAGLFPSPYSCTSLREYFAIGFEEYYLRNRTELRQLCPVLYNKLSELEFPED